MGIGDPARVLNRNGHIVLIRPDRIFQSLDNKSLSIRAIRTISESRELECSLAFALGNGHILVECHTGRIGNGDPELGSPLST